MDYAFYKYVPKTIPENLAYRRELLKRCTTDKKTREAVMEMSRSDTLYWINTFCLLYEPRNVGDERVIPFVSWPHQDVAVMAIEEHMGRIDIGIEKSRGEGASWLVLMIFLKHWLFDDHISFGLVSKDEDSVDNPRNPGSLFWKLEWQLNKLPSWMVPKFSRVLKGHTLYNEVNHSTIVGFAATGNVATGDRKTAFLMDEFAKFSRGDDYDALNSTQHVSNCRIFLSTPFGPDGAYYDVMKQPSNMKKIVLHWTQNPTRNAGIYKVRLGPTGINRVELEDRDYWIRRANENGFTHVDRTNIDRAVAEVRDGSDLNPFKYKFLMSGPYVKDGFPRSPWYDNECSRPGATPKGIAQELDLDYGGSASRFFNADVLQRLITNTCRHPVVRGEMMYDPEQLDESNVKTYFKQGDSGRLRLWISPSVDNKPPINVNYVIGCDICSGAGGRMTSNSVACVLNRFTGEQVAEFATSTLEPFAFAQYVIAMAYWFRGKDGPAQIIWEANGPPGALFGKRVMEIGYSNIYFRTAVEEINGRETKKPGWWSTLRTKPPLLGEFARAADSGDLTIRSEACLEEAKYYVNLPGGKIEHVGSLQSDDPAESGERHGDRVIAAALAWLMASQYKPSDNPKSLPVKKDVPEHSFLGRRLRASRGHRERKYWPYR